MIAAEHERARPPSGPTFTDAVTFSFGDPRAGAYGLARLGLSPDGAGTLTASVLAVLFSGREPVAALARGGIPLDGGGDWESLALPGLATTVEEPLGRWTVALEDGEHGFELEFEALGPAAELPADDPVAAAGGMTGYEQLCRVQGSVRVGGHAQAIDCLGQRGHAWGEPDWAGIGSVRTVAAWIVGGSGLALTAIRPAAAESHAAGPVWAVLIDAAGPVPVSDPRLSTTYDAAGRQRHAGLELWLGADDEYPRRGSGDVICGSTLELGQLRLDCAFFRWRLEGRDGVGRYDVITRA